MNEALDFYSKDVFEQVMSRCDEIRDISEQIAYLEWVIREHKQWCHNNGLSGKPPTFKITENELSSMDKFRIQQGARREQQRRFAKNIKSEIEYRRNLLRTQPDTGAKSKGKHESQAVAETITRNPDFTTARQVLAIHYLLQYCHASQASSADVARFIEFLTGKNYKNIYKRVCNPLGSRDKELNEDLRFVRSFFEKLGLTEIVKMINNEINSGSS